MESVTGLMSVSWAESEACWAAAESWVACAIYLCRIEKIVWSADWTAGSF